MRKTHQQMIEEVTSVVELRNRQYSQVGIEAGLSTAFGCTLQGVVPEDDTIRVAVTMADLGVDEVGLSDTCGYANPAQVKRLFKRLQVEFGEEGGRSALPQHARTGTG